VAVDVLDGWLLLRDARGSARKRELARVAIADALPRIHSHVEVLRAPSRAPIEARDTLLAMQA